MAALAKAIRSLQETAAEEDELLSQLPKLPPSRALVASEVKALEANGNTCADWSRVTVLHDVPEGAAALNVHRCVFAGQVVLGSFANVKVCVGGVGVPAGCTDTTVVDCVLFSGCLVKSTQLLANSVLMPGAAVMGCGVVTATSTSFANGAVVSVGPESGGREVQCYATMSFETAATVATCRGDASLLHEYAKAVEAYAHKATAPYNVFGSGSVCVACTALTSVFVGPSATVEGSTVEQTTILSGKGKDHTWIRDSTVEQSIVQWGCSVHGMGLVHNSVMFEASHVERHGKLISSILAPNSGVSEGEVTSCLMGPFVGFHHQSLLIATLWPEGKGNVGYGANVGSNHTGKMNDQELWPGEGMFFGLATAIKFPSNFTEAPYSMIATGVTTLPQRVCFPFSLINSVGEMIPGVSPAFNEIMPGWILANNMFTLIRNEVKFKSRNKATRNTFQMHWEIMRPDIIELCVKARTMLSNAAPTKLRTEKGVAVFTSQHVKGLGKNYMLEGSRTSGVAAYTQFIQYYALLGLLKEIERDMEVVGPNTPLDTLSSSSSARWAHELAMLVAEFPGSSVRDALLKLPEMATKIAKAVASSKAKDDQRGPSIIPDYSVVQGKAADNKVVQEALNRAHAVRERVVAISKRWDAQAAL